jgi:hypothetical protein
VILDFDLKEKNGIKAKVKKEKFIKYGKKTKEFDFSDNL